MGILVQKMALCDAKNAVLVAWFQYIVYAASRSYLFVAQKGTF